MKLLRSHSLALALGLTLTHSAMAEVQIDNGYVRATPPGVPNGAAFMTLTNSAGQPVSLISAKTEIARKAELHNHIDHNGMMQMRQVKAIEIPAQGSVELKPGSYHIMMMGLSGQLKEGQQVDMTLKFSDGEQQQLSLPVQRVRAATAMGHADHSQAEKPMTHHQH